MATNSTAQCTKVGGVNNPRESYDVAVSPDSRHVYVKTTGGLAVLDRNATSLAIAQKPALAGCFSEGNVLNCDEVDGLGRSGYKVDVSPDGGQVYVAFEEEGEAGSGSSTAPRTAPCPAPGPAAAELPRVSWRPILLSL